MAPSPHHPAAMIAGRLVKEWWRLTPCGLLTSRFGGPPGLLASAAGLVCAGVFVARGLIGPAAVALALGVVSATLEIGVDRRRRRRRELRRARDREDFLRRSTLEAPRRMD